MNIDYGISTTEFQGTDIPMLTIGNGKSGFVINKLIWENYTSYGLLVTYMHNEDYNIGDITDVSNKQFNPEDLVIMFNFTNSKSVQSMIDQLENIRNQLEAKEQQQ